MEEKKLMSWLNKANGWQRLWVVYAILVVLYNLSIAYRYEHPLHMLYVISVIVFSTYALGLAISWIIKGFKG